MSARPAGWVAALAVMVLVTVAAVVGYLAAPFDPAPNLGADTGAPGMVEAEHRIVAVNDDGELVVLDDRDGSLSEVVRSELDGEVSDLEVTAGREAAYLERSDGSVVLVRLETGVVDRHGEGRAVALGPIAFPQLPRTVERPRVERLAVSESTSAGPTVVLENLTTGARQHLETDASGAIEQIGPLALSPFENRLFGVANDGTALFRVEVDRAESLSQAVVVEAPEDVGRYVSIAPLGDTVAAIVERPGGATDLVEVDRRTLEPAAVLHASEDHVLRFVDADAKASSLLVTTDDATLLLLRPGSDEEPRQLASGIALAAW